MVAWVAVDGGMSVCGECSSSRRLALLLFVRMNDVR
jgi:hypothetical protein